MESKLKVKNGKFKCSVCGKWKTSDEFYIDRRNKTGLTCSCKQCRKPKDKARRLKARYNLTEADLTALLAKQGNKCAVCSTNLTRGKAANTISHIDHDHKTGKVRGVLCMGCNVAAGHIKDCHKTARKLMKYLKNGGVA